MDDEEIDLWWAQREEAEFPSRRAIARHQHEETHYVCSQCGTAIPVEVSTCPKCQTCYGCN